MQTFNSFNELANQSAQPLVTDMSVFNTKGLVAPEDVAAKLHWDVEGCVQFAIDLLESANAHGAVELLTMYKNKDYPRWDDMKAGLHWA